MTLRKIIASDIGTRDGIGVEFYNGDTLLVEIFRNDTSKTRTVHVFDNPIDFETMEKCIEIFRKEIPWDFQD